MLKINILSRILSIGTRIGRPVPARQKELCTELGKAGKIDNFTRSFRQQAGTYKKQLVYGIR